MPDSKYPAARIENALRESPKSVFASVRKVVIDLFPKQDGYVGFNPSQFLVHVIQTVQRMYGQYMMDEQNALRNSAGKVWRTFRCREKLNDLLELALCFIDAATSSILL